MAFKQCSKLHVYFLFVVMCVVFYFISIRINISNYIIHLSKLRIILYSLPGGESGMGWS